ncbi:MAG: hypothetical protein IPL61_06885 [Myxococcales bacterium]|nr:hypothetical protein [Myxococcales bacterium]
MVPTRDDVLVGFPHAAGDATDPAVSRGFRQVVFAADDVDARLEEIFFGLEKCITTTPEFEIGDVVQWRRRIGARDLVLRLDRLDDGQYALVHDIVLAGDEPSLEPLLTGQVSLEGFDLTLDLDRQTALDPSSRGWGTLHISATPITAGRTERLFDFTGATNAQGSPWRRVTHWDLGPDGGALALEAPEDGSNFGASYARWGAAGGRLDNETHYPGTVYVQSDCWGDAGVEVFRGFGVAATDAGPWDFGVAGLEDACAFGPLADAPRAIPGLDHVPAPGGWDAP